MAMHSRGHDGLQWDGHGEAKEGNDAGLCGEWGQCTLKLSVGRVFSSVHSTHFSEIFDLLCPNCYSSTI